MQYVSGIHALNLPCMLHTCGDWHSSSLKWDDITMYDTEQMFFKEYGIEMDKYIPNHKGKYAVANHIRALLDMLEKGYFTIAQGMRHDYICTNEYDEEIFRLVLSMNVLPHWEKIDQLMEHEYKMKWINYKEKNNDELENRS